MNYELAVRRFNAKTLPAGECLEWSAAINRPIDGSFDPLTGDQMADRLKRALELGFPYLLSDEIAVEVIADAYDPAVPR